MAQFVSRSTRRILGGGRHHYHSAALANIALSRAAFAGLESLENRMLMSSVAMSGNALLFNADLNSSNTIAVSLSSDGQNLQANIDGNTGSFPVSNVASIRIFGGNAGDSIIIDPHVTTALSVNAGSGNDYISAGGGPSTVYGGAGNDTILGNGGVNQFHGGAGDDSLVGGSGQSNLYGDDGNDTIYGGSGSDLISGGTGNNATDGPAGDTIINNTNSQAAPATFVSRDLGAHILFKSNNTIFAGEAVQANGLNSGLGTGGPNTDSFHWNFGDTGSQYNELDGWNAAHLYNTPGLYTVTLTITDPSGAVSVDMAPVMVNPTDSMRQIYIAPWGNDGSDGSSSIDPVQTVARANALLGSNTQLFFAGGGTYNMESPLNLNGYSNVEISTWGSSTQPILMWDGTGVYTQLIVAQPGSSNVTISNLTFDSIYSNGNGEPSAIKLNGNNLAVMGCTFFHINDAIDLSGNPIGTLIQGNSSPTNSDLRAYFVWVQGSNTVILGNYVANSAREHVIRIGGAKQTLIAYNNFANISGADWGDTADGVKGVITIQYGSFAYVAHNVLNGPSSVGPLGTTQFSSLVSNFNGQFKYAVFDSNMIYNGPFEFEPGGFHTMLRNNVIVANNASAIIIQPYDELYGRIVSDAEILGNTVINHGVNGNFLQMENIADGTVLADNLYVANNLRVGAFQSAPVYVGDSSLNSFALISNNIWSPSTTVSGGINYVNPIWWDPSGYLTPGTWNGMASGGGGDLFQTTHLTQNLTPVFGGNGQGASYGAAIPGLFADFYGNARSKNGTTVGAVQA